MRDDPNNGCEGDYFSDHLAIYGIRKLHRVPLPPPRMIEIRNYKHYDTALFCDDLKNIPWDILELEQTPDEAWLCFKDLFLTAADKHAPIVTRRVRGRSVPWLTPEIKISCTSAIMSIRKRYQQTVNFTGVITKDYAMLSTPKCVKRNVIIIPTSSQMTRTLKKCGRH